jgi:hypothetical protein
LLSGSEGSLGRVCRAIDIFPTLALGRDASTATCDSKSASSFRASSPRISLSGYRVEEGRERREKREERREKREERREKREEIDSLRGFTPGTLQWNGFPTRSAL